MKLDSLGLIGRWLGCDCPDRKIAGFAIDSREVQEGFLFFALRGQKFDGHDFLQEVGKRGGVAAVVDRSYKGETGGLVLLVVEDVVAALQTLAAEIQKRRQQRIIGVTGSVGKTTTKEFIATLLSEKYSVAKTPGNSNSQVGLPLAILRLSGDEEVFVAEMSMSEIGHIEKLVQIAPPEIAVVTKVGYSHVDTITGGLEGVARAKAEILVHPSTKWAVIEQGAFQFPVMQTTGSCTKISCVEQTSFRLPFTESHLCENFAIAERVACLMGLSTEEIKQGIKKLKTAQLRFEKIERGGAVIINDCYNASPESMKAALDNLPKPAFGAKTIVVLGEMTTLGKYSEEGHKTVGAIALLKADHLLCFGKRCMPMVEMFTAAGKPAEFFRDLEQLKTALFELSKPGDVILIKGSNSNKLWTLLD